MTADSLPSEMRGKLLGMVKTESERLNALAQGILSLARLERDNAVETINRAPTDLPELLRECAERLRPQAESKGIELTVMVPESYVTDCDAQLLSSAISNLVTNAIRHSGSKTVLLSLSVIPEGVRIEVEDRGIGIPPDQRDRVFERFHRVDEARNAQTGGAGLGLAIVRRIARLHGGDVTLEPVEPSGCRFVLSLPLVAVE